jgi:hypothetical protein
MIHKLLWLVDNKASAMGLPRDNVAKTISLHLVKHSMQLEGESDGDTTTAAVWLIIIVILVSIIRMIVIIMNDKVTIVLLGRLARLLGLSPALGPWFL